MRNANRSSIIAVLTAALLVVGACKGRRGNSSASGSSETPEPDPLVAALRPTLLEKTCGEGSYERVCFALDAHRCGELVGKHYDACSEEHANVVAREAKAPPATIGTILGGCTEKRLIQELESLRQVNRQGRCKDPSSFFR